MSDYEQIAWAPLCVGLTLAGLAASWLALQRRGAAAGLRGAAWSLLPLAAYLTGAVKLVWQIGTAVTRWVSGFVFSPMVWAGIAVTLVAVLLFVISGALRRRAAGKAPATLDEGTRPGRQIAPAGPSATAPGAKADPKADPKAKARTRKPAPADDEFADIEDILRRRGIT